MVYKELLELILGWLDILSIRLLKIPSQTFSPARMCESDRPSASWRWTLSRSSPAVAVSAWGWCQLPAPAWGPLNKIYPQSNWQPGATSPAYRSRLPGRWRRPCGWVRSKGLAHTYTWYIGFGGTPPHPTTAPPHRPYFPLNAPVAKA